MGTLATSHFGEKESSLFQVARACLIYSLVPYLGIVFIPFGLIAGSIAIYAGGEGWRQMRLCLIGIVVMLGVQIFQWWLLYFVPTLNHPLP